MFVIVAGVYVAGPVAGATLGAFAYQLIRTPAPAA
jgi:glycerol uptake facilitator-like aquaporin